MRELRESLARRLEIVADREFYARDPAGHLEALRAASQSLDSIVAALPPGTDPMLRHYLERQSYQKALAWLDAHLSLENAF